MRDFSQYKFTFTLKVALEALKMHRLDIKKNVQTRIQIHKINLITEFVSRSEHNDDFDVVVVQKLQEIVKGGC